MKTSTFTSIFQGLLFAFCLSNCALLAESKKARKHGFKIVNKTAYPIQVSLNQVGPLYWEIVKPGKTWHRPTGAVWFTIKAETFIEGTSKKIKTADAVVPIATIVASTLAAAFTAGLSTVASAAAGGVGALSSSVAGTSAALVAAGLPANAALAVGGAMVGGTGAAVTATGLTKTNLIKKVFTRSNVMVSKRGCYARKCPTWEVTGGPRFEKMNVDGKEVANLVGSPMKLRKV
eukprot:scaffold4688_cov77-Skeletonema_dohrnii-CCMP3373.AAC.4